MSNLTIESLRGEFVESRQRVHVAVMDVDGERVASAGDPSFPTFMRSAAKPFQAMPAILDGAVGHYHVTAEELAVACASHNGEDRHVEIVRGLLERIGCDESALECGPHRSLAIDLGVRVKGEKLPDDLQPQSRIASNCSGKHTLMLALARHRKWPVARYNRPDHPVQERCREEVARWSGVPASHMREGTDGCGVVSFQLPLEGVATAFARLGASHEAEAVMVRNAMMTHPHLVAGKQRLCTALMELYPKQVVTKVGAGGVYGAALPTHGLGLALKVESGDNRGAMIALLWVLSELGLKPNPAKRLLRFARLPVLDTRNRIIGRVRPRGSLTFE